MRQDTAEAIMGMLLWAVPALVALLALQRPSERFGDVTHRYLALLGLYLGTGLMVLRGGWIVLAYAALGMLVLLGIGYVADALHKHHTRVEERAKAASR